MVYMSLDLPEVHGACNKKDNNFRQVSVWHGMLHKCMYAWYVTQVSVCMVC